MITRLKMQASTKITLVGKFIWVVSQSPIVTRNEDSSWDMKWESFEVESVMKVNAKME